MPTFTFETYVERNDREHAVEVEYRVIAARSATTLTPAEPETVEITALRCDIDLTDDEYETLLDECHDHARDAIEDARADAAEFAAMCRAERIAA